MIKQISIKTQFGWISAFEKKGRIIKVKFGKTRKKSISNNLRKFRNIFFIYVVFNILEQ